MSVQTKQLILKVLRRKTMAKFEGVQAEILFGEGNQLVSAGAGSGKTTVMIEKISNLILNEDVDVDNILVVTFTVLAAQEMKDRLVKKLTDKLTETENKSKILEIIDKVKTASIDTIDGFCSKTIKKYFYELEISPNVEIISDATRDYFLTLAMKKTIDNFSKRTEEVSLLLDLFGGKRRNFKNLEKLILEHYFNIINIEDYKKFLSDCVKEYSDSIKSEKVVNLHICQLVNNIQQEIKSNYSEFSKDVQDKLMDFSLELEKFNKNLSFKFNLNLLKSLNVIEFSKKEKTEFLPLEDVENKILPLKKLKEKFQENEIDEDFNEKNLKILQYFEIFIGVLNSFIENYNNLKEKNNLIDFNDLNRLMLKLLKNEKVKIELQNKFKYIFIDEYQDVNPLQDSLMTSIAGPCSKVFMVGDVKQSIYGFRGSSPEWFLSKYDQFKSNSGKGLAYDMNLNFRSNPLIMGFVDDVFSRLMTKKSSDIDYLKDCMIDARRDDIIDDKVKLVLIKEEKEEKEIAKGIYSVKENVNKKIETKKNAEAEKVAQIITELVGQEFYDANEKSVRKLTYKDIAILSRSEKNDDSVTLIETLREKSIPVNINNKLDITSSEGIKLILSILKCVSYSGDDVDILASMLALSEITIDEIVEIRQSESFFDDLCAIDGNQKVIDFNSTLEDIRSMSYVSTNAELISYILNEKKLKYYILKQENGEKEVSLIKEFLNKLSEAENSLNLSEFVEVVESNVSNGSDFSSLDSENSVTFQTIHKSKGLEYPVVILYNANKDFLYLKDNDTINFNLDVGLGIDYYDQSNRRRMMSLPKLAIKLKNNEKGYKEELRLLYVALTRAKNKLIILGTYKDFPCADKEIKKTSFMNMILSCFASNLSGENVELKNCSIEFCDDEILLSKQKTESQLSVKRIDDDFVYPNSEKFSVTLKNTVTGINAEKSQKFVAKECLNNFNQYDMSEDKAKIGTHYHSALEQLDFNAEYVQNTNFDDVDYEKIELAHTILSPLIAGAKNVKKEAEFMMYVPYNEIVSSEITDKILIQGVVDLIVEREDSIDIVDYKFSSLPIKQLKEKYKEQLKLYKKAVESAMKKPVENMFIYSINSGELL